MSGGRWPPTPLAFPEPQDNNQTSCDQNIATMSRQRSLLNSNWEEVHKAVFGL